MSSDLLKPETEKQNGRHESNRNNCLILWLPLLLVAKSALFKFGCILLFEMCSFKIMLQQTPTECFLVEYQLQSHGVWANIGYKKFSDSRQTISSLKYAKLPSLLL